jgi:hypothetical protein
VVAMYSRDIGGDPVSIDNVNSFDLCESFTDSDRLNPMEDVLPSCFLKLNVFDVTDKRTILYVLFSASVIESWS